MRKFYALLLIPALLSFAVQLNAQSCDPNTELADTVVVDPLPFQVDFPDRGILDTACVNNYFETVIQIQIPSSAVILGNEVTINGATMNTEGAINDMPEGFDYICNPPNCEFEPDSVSCVVLFGTAVTDSIHDLTIDVIIDIGIPLGQTLPNATLAPGNYYLHVRGEDGPNCTVISAVNYVDDAGFQLSIAPNPTATQAVMTVQLEQSGRYNLGIHDLLGRKVMTRTLDLVAGENQVNIDASNLPVGMYVFTLDDGQKGASGRLVVQR